VPFISAVEAFRYRQVPSSMTAPQETGPNPETPPKIAARFPRSARLLRHADFEQAYEKGRRHFSASMTVFYLARFADGEPERPERAPSGIRIGFTVGRAFGGAVQRNRMKRRLREAVRLSLPTSAVAADVVINPKKRMLTAEFSEVLEEVRRAFRVIEQKLSSATSADGGSQ